MVGKYLEEDEEGGQDKMEEEDSKEKRKRRKRKLRRLVRRANGIPSFEALLKVDLDASDDNNEESEEEKEKPPPKRIVIDVDVELGLKQREIVLSDSDESIVAVKEINHSTVPADEGWYEGVVSPMALPDDSSHLNELQQWIRRNLEYFSATEQDVNASQSSRRISVTVGKVGIRCIHCAKEMEKRSGMESITSDGMAPAIRAWPTGAASYPVNIAGIHSVCAQKPQLHFIDCPFIPAVLKSELAILMKEASSNAKRTKRSEGAIPSALYFAISAKRIGLVDTEDGMRFGRDLALAPLPLETVKLQFKDQLPAYARSSGVIQGTSGYHRLTADEESERVLAESLTENDDPKKFLVRSSDKALISDYMFLVMKQMAICNASQMDLASRGKKTKLMRIGFAGFCCRHCVAANNYLPNTSDFSCRSFSSAADNLSSAITNSFVAHLQRCPNVPHRTKKALSAYKKIHQKQMAQLPYGSQRRMMHEIWNRMREADITEEEMNEKCNNTLSPPPVAPLPPIESLSCPQIIENVASDALIPTGPDSEHSALPSSYPRSIDPETLAVLGKAEQDWELNENDGLILPSDRIFVSDYVFLAMRQLKMVSPDPLDAAQRSRRASKSGLPGLGCIHCDGQATRLPSGRSFPSAPDNFASALNNSMYNHLQACPSCPSELKRALANLRKLHSSQCASLKVGSQRRYFNALYNRLCNARSEIITDLNGTSVTPEVSTLPGFLTIAMQPTRQPSMFMCRGCHMVPFHLRTENSVLHAPISKKAAQQHLEACKNDAFDLRWVSQVLGVAIEQYYVGDWDVVVSDSFKVFIEEAVGGNQLLAETFTSMVRDRQQGHVEVHTTETAKTKGLWALLPSKIDSTKIIEKFAKHAVERAMDPDLLNYPAIVDYLMLISPAFTLERSSPSSEARLTKF